MKIPCTKVHSINLLTREVTSSSFGACVVMYEHPSCRGNVRSAGACTCACAYKAWIYLQVVRLGTTNGALFAEYIQQGDKYEYVYITGELFLGF